MRFWRVGVSLGHLDERDRRADEEWECLLQQPKHWHEVGVEDAVEINFGHGQRVVDIAGLGTVVAEPAHVAAPQGPGQGSDLIRAPLVEDPRA